MSRTCRRLHPWPALIALLHTIEHETEIVDPGQLAAYQASGDIKIRRTGSQVIGCAEEITKSNRD
jgi:hypothetical protein